MTLPRLAAMSAHWQQNPPLHVSIAGLVRSLGGKRQSTTTETTEDNAKLFDTIKSAPEFE